MQPLKNLFKKDCLGENIYDKFTTFVALHI